MLLITAITLFTFKQSVTMTATVMIKFPTSGGIPNCCSNIDPLPAIMTTATPNRKNVINRSIAKPKYLPHIL